MLTSVPAPALAKLGRGEQAIDDFGERVRGLVLHERVDLLRRRRQADEIEVDPAQQRQLVRVANRFQAFGLQACENELVDVASRPARVLDDGRRGLLHRLEGPPFLRLARVVFFDHLRHAFARIGRAHCHPRLEVFDHRLGQLAATLLGRHGEVFVGVAHRLDEQALLKIARHHRWSVVAAAPDALAGIEQEAALDLLGLLRVALETLVGEDGTDLLLEEIELFGRCCCGWLRRSLVSNP